ncbi:MAG: energy-dependent translational throttle protein EttA [Phycisphaerales bacterium]
MAADQPTIIYSMWKVSKKHGTRTVIQDISLSYYHGAKIGVIGLNGSGKSTLLRIMAGVDTAFEGQAQLADGYTVGYLEQDPLVDETKTVREVVEEGAAETVALLKEFDAINEKFAEEMTPEEMERLLERQGEVQDALDRADAWELDSQLRMAMDALRCPPDDQTLDTCSGGERRRVALCRLLLRKPDILLLDEPTNHLDAESIQWLEEHLKRYQGTVILVTHDRYFLDTVTEWILELDRGHGVPWQGNYSSWLEQKQVQLAESEKQESQRRKALNRELTWIRNTKKNRQTQNKARMTNYESMLGADAAERARDVEIFIPAGPRLGGKVIEAEGLNKAYGEKLLMDDLSFRVPQGSIVGIVGPNGAGKTTLFRMITGDETADGGTFSVGDTVKLAHVDQSRSTLEDGITVWESISDGADEIRLGNFKMNSRAYVARFGFTGGDQQKKVSELSGGEQNRVHLARMLTSGANVILLDEPSNDLDVNTLRALEDALLEFAGCAIVISHDRWFLDRIATHILAFEGDSNVRWFPGNHAAYEADRRERLGEAAGQPKRIQYRKLTRG